MSPSGARTPICCLGGEQTRTRSRGTALMTVSAGGRMAACPATARLLQSPAAITAKPGNVPGGWRWFGLLRLGEAQGKEAWEQPGTLQRGAELSQRPGTTVRTWQDGRVLRGTAAAFALSLSV